MFGFVLKIHRGKETRKEEVRQEKKEDEKRWK